MRRRRCSPSPLEKAGASTMIVWLRLSAAGKGTSRVQWGVVSNAQQMGSVAYSCSKQT